MNELRNDQEAPAARSQPVAAATAVVCESCRRPNRADCQFCAACGKPLWMDCPSCGSRCAAAEAFCSVCGINRQEVIQKHIVDVEAAFEQSRQLEARHCYDQAVGVLHELALPNHPLLEKQHARLQGKIQSLLETNDRFRTSAAESVATADGLIKQHAYEDACRLLEQIPSPYRTQAANQRLDTARQRHAKITSLIDTIREAAAKRHYLELAPAVEQLLVLQPGHRLGEKLARQLRDRFYRRAKNELSQHRYDEAQALLAAIPSGSRDEAVEQLARQIGELTWMLEDIRRAPVITPTLLAIARRLHQAVPGDDNVAQINGKLRELAGRPITCRRFPWPAWAPCNTEPKLGCRASWLAGFRTLKANRHEVDAVLREHPGRFFVAAGLALQGLDRSEIKLHLRPPEKQGVFGKLTGGKKNPAAASAWGVDLGEAALKAIKLSRAPETGEITIEAAILIEHQTRHSPTDAKTDRSGLAAELLADFCGRVSIEKTDRVCCNFPSRLTLGRFLSLPPASPKKLAEIVRMEAARAIPVPLDELSWGHHAFAAESASETKDSAGRNVLLIAAKKHDVRERLRLFEETGLRVDILQCDAVALSIAAAHDCLGDGGNSPVDPQPLALLDVGTRSSNLVVCGDGKVWFRTLRFGGTDFTEAILRPFKLTYEQAEALKRQPARAKQLSRLDRELDSVFTRFMGELSRSLSAFEKDHQGRRAARILGIGGGMQLHGLLRRLSQ